MKFKKDKAGQVTIFIILALILVFFIIALFMINRENDSEDLTDKGPRKYIQDCVRDSVQRSVDVVLDNGGRINPSQYLQYNSSKYNYLCYQGDFYLGCYNTHPMLELIVEYEIREDTKDDVQRCFDSMREDYEARGFSVSGGSTVYSIDLVPGRVNVNLEKPVRVSAEGVSNSHEDFSFSILSPLYELVFVSRDIVNSESEFCNAEYNGYMILYPQFDIRRIDYSDSKIYRVIDRASGDEFRFAVRSCAFAPGI